VGAAKEENLFDADERENLAQETLYLSLSRGKTEKREEPPLSRKRMTGGKRVSQ